MNKYRKQKPFFISQSAQLSHQRDYTNPQANKQKTHYFIGVIKAKNPFATFNNAQGCREGTYSHSPRDKGTKSLSPSSSSLVRSFNNCISLSGNRKKKIKTVKDSVL